MITHAEMLERIPFPAQRRKLRQLEQRASIQAITIGPTLDVEVGYEMFRTGRERDGIIRTDGSFESRNRWEYA